MCFCLASWDIYVIRQSHKRELTRNYAVCIVCMHLRRCAETDGPEDAKCKKAQRDNRQCLTRLNLKKALGPSVIHSMPGAKNNPQINTTYQIEQTDEDSSCTNIQTTATSRCFCALPFNHK